MEFDLIDEIESIPKIVRKAIRDYTISDEINKHLRTLSKDARDA